MINNPGKVSVIIPTYNQEEYVRETVESVLSQTYKNIEIIVTDDGSTDGTTKIIGEIAEQNPGKIIPVLNSENTGIPSNLNRGLKKATGEYIAWLGGDDLMFPDKIQKQVEILEIRQDAVGSCHDVEVFQSPSGKILGIFSELYNGNKGFKEGGAELWFEMNYKMLPSSVMFRAKYMPDHLFDERLKYANDWLFDIELFRNGKCVPINEVLGKYRRHEKNITGSELIQKSSLEEALMVLVIVEARYPELGSLVKKRRIALLFKESLNCMRSKQLNKSRAYIKNAMREGAVIRGIVALVVFSLMGEAISKRVSSDTRILPRWVLYCAKLFSK